MNNSLCLTVITLLLAATSLSAATHYVSLGSTNPAPPYTNWITAATNIQNAVEVAEAGDEIVVTNGTYASGGRVVYGATNRVAVIKRLTVQSVNGSQTTVIDGGSAVRCAYLTNGATLVGFTLANGWAFYSNNYGGGVYCESTNAVLSKCVLSANSAAYGAGSYGGTLNNCMVSGNTGSGAYGGSLNNCTVTGNSGWGATSAKLNNCAVFANRGGGANGGTLNNCTVTGNSGWGAYSATLTNCIVYFNSDPHGGPYGGNYYSSSTLNYCCTTPLPGSGLGNITAEPQLADPAHLSAGSPCRGAGSPAYASGSDIDGQPWLNPPSIGCDEFYAGAINGPLTVAIWAAYTNVATGFAVSFTAQILGHASASSWDFGDGTVVSNRPYASAAWRTPGDYLVVLRAFNDSYPEGVTATTAIHVSM